MSIVANAAPKPSSIRDERTSLPAPGSVKKPTSMPINKSMKATKPKAAAGLLLKSVLNSKAFWKFKKRPSGQRTKAMVQFNTRGWHAKCTYPLKQYRLG
jgi:hypothetical protein